MAYGLSSGRPIGALSSWVGVLVYFIIAFIIGVSGIKVFEQCPVTNDKLAFIGGGRATATTSVIVNAILVALIIGAQVYTRSGFSESYVSFVGTTFDSGLIGKVIAAAISILAVISLITTVAAEFMGLETANQCNKVMNVPEMLMSDQHKSFVEAYTALNRVYGLMLLVLVSLGVLIVSAIMMSMNAKNNMATMYR